MEDLISVIVPVYNVEKYLVRCLETIVMQTYKNIEIILVDDGSTDTSGTICDEYAKKDTRIKVIHKENGGVSSARNIGLKESKGKWIAFIDGDDYIDKEYCKTLLEAGKKENSDIIICGYKRIYEDRKEIINCNENKEYNSNELLLKVLNVQNSVGFCHMKLIKKEIIKDTILNENLSIAEDALFSIQLCKNISKAILVAKPLYNYRFNNNSAVRKYNKEFANNILKAMQEAKKYITNEYKDNDSVIKGYYNYVMYHILLIAVNYCYNPNNGLLNKERKKSLKNICQISEFSDAIKKSNYNDLSITRKITVFTIKHKLYCLTGAICLYRQRQFKRRR